MTSFNSATSDRIPELNNASLKSAFRELSRLLPASSGELNTSSQPRTARISSNEQSAFLAADLESDDGQDDESDNEASDADFVEEEELSGDDEEVSNHDLRHVYNDAIAYKDWKVAGDNANCLAHRFLSQGDVQSALKWFDRDLQASKQLMSQWTQSKRTTNGHILCSTHQYLGECYRQLGDFDQAIKQHQEQKRLCNQCKDSPNFECFTELQRCEVELGEDYFRWAEHLGEEIEGLRKRIRAEADIEHKQALRSKSESITLQIKTHYEASLKHRKAALEMAERKGSLLLRARSHTNLGLVLAALNKCDDAIVEYNRALKCAFEMTSKHPLAPELPILDIESLVSEHFSEEHEMQYVKSLNDKQKHQREMSLVERSRAHCGLAAVYMDYLKCADSVYLKVFNLFNFELLFSPDLLL
jgi:tetratricopeptide (TPR) repeat protein